jgi:23S rRNA (cytosine1962-C5)-methyltransferase
MLKPPNEEKAKTILLFFGYMPDILYFRTRFWASRCACAFRAALASGYPLHHLRASRSVVPLLSLSQCAWLRHAGIGSLAHLYHEQRNYTLRTTNHYSTMSIIKVILKHHKEEALRRFHPWVFSGAIHRFDGGTPVDGDIVEVWSGGKEFLGVGHYHAGSIAVRVLAFDAIVIDVDFWYERLASALMLRQRMVVSDNTNAYRLMHGEGDQCSGLIIDVYGDVVVFQAHSIGMHRSRLDIAAALQKLFAEYNLPLRGIYDKSKNALPTQYSAEHCTEDYIWYASEEEEKPYSIVMRENGHLFEVNWKEGQKTGFFLDQRDNRQLLAQHCKDKSVLNTFCYSGGFSIYALQSGASKVVSVDASERAIGLVEKNISLNDFDPSRHESVVADVTNYLKTTETYDIVILDPPAYAKTLDKRHQAVQGYKRLNIAGLKAVKSGGLLFTFSCSQVVDTQLFYQTIVAAGIEAGRNIRVLHHLSQGADHPVNLFHPESSYLKGLVLYVD